MKELFQVSQACAVNKFPGHAIGHSIENYIHLPKNEMKYLIIQTRKKKEREREATHQHHFQITKGKSNKENFKILISLELSRVKEMLTNK